MFFFAILSLALTAAGTYQSYQAQNRAADVAEKTAQYNATVDRQQAEHESDVAAENMRRQSTTKRKKIERARARNAGSGVTNAGSVMDELVDTSDTLERDIRDVAYKSTRDTDVAMAGANMVEWEGEQKAEGYRMNATADLLAGAGKMAGQASKMAGSFTPGGAR